MHALTIRNGQMDKVSASKFPVSVTKAAVQNAQKFRICILQPAKMLGFVPSPPLCPGARSVTCSARRGPRGGKNPQRLEKLETMHVRYVG